MTIITAASADLWPARDALKVPESQRVHSVKLWCEFGVFGLSLYDDQTPWFTLIELIQIAAHLRDHGKIIFPGLSEDEAGSPVHEALSYDVPVNTSLRHLLFRDKEVGRLASQPSGDPAALWDRWLDHAAREFPMLPFGYLKARFEADFMQMAEAIDLLRSAEVEKFGARRWTSRHLVPLGRSMLFPDVKENAGDFVLDRRFFQRTGELLYLMLNRSTRRGELEPLLIDRLLATECPWDRLARRLRPDRDEGKVTSTNIGYLPIPHMDRYDRLAEDWISLLTLKSLPVEDCLDALMRLSGLHEVIYIVERAAHETGRVTPPPFALDLSGTARNNPVFACATESYKTHRSMPMRALDAYVDRFAMSEEWMELDDSLGGRQRAAAVLHGRFLWKPARSSNPAQLASPRDQLEKMMEATRDRNHDVGSALTAHARRIGLLMAQRRAGTWYSPSDGLLEALVLANVTEAMEFGAFLRRLRERYHIVVGPEEARAADGSLPAPMAALKRNEQRLEERLRVLGFIDRKSDDCAFVMNPFHRR